MCPEPESDQGGLPDRHVDRLAAEVAGADPDDDHLTEPEHLDELAARWAADPDDEEARAALDEAMLAAAAPELEACRAELERLDQLAAPELERPDPMRAAPEPGPHASRDPMSAPEAEAPELAEVVGLDEARAARGRPAALDQAPTAEDVTWLAELLAAELRRQLPVVLGGLQPAAEERSLGLALEAAEAAYRQADARADMERAMAEAGLSRLQRQVVRRNAPHLSACRPGGDLATVAAELSVHPATARRAWAAALAKLRLDGGLAEEAS